MFRVTCKTKKHTQPQNKTNLSRFRDLNYNLTNQIANHSKTKQRKKYMKDSNTDAEIILSCSKMLRKMIDS